MENDDGDRSRRRTYLSTNERGIDNPSESWDDFDVRSRGPSSFPGKGVIAGRSVLERFGKIRTAKRRERGKAQREERKHGGKTKGAEVAEGTASPSEYDPEGARLD